MQKVNPQRAWYLRNREKCLAESKARRESNPEKTAKYLKEWTEKNRARSNEIKRAWALRNKEKDKQCKKDYEIANPLNRKGNSARRRARRLQAIPKWLSLQDRKLMRKIYRECPKGYEVDHREPLQGKNVCGIHVPWNLEYLTIKANRTKGNR